MQEARTLVLLFTCPLICFHIVAPAKSGGPIPFLFVIGCVDFERAGMTMARPFGRDCVAKRVAERKIATKGPSFGTKTIDVRCSIELIVQPTLR